MAELKRWQCWHCWRWQPTLLWPEPSKVANWFGSLANLAAPQTHRKTTGATMSTRKTQYVTVRLPGEIMTKLKAEAERNTRSLSAQVLHYIRQELDKVKA
jgi:hypothetical protein